MRHKRLLLPLLALLLLPASASRSDAKGDIPGKPVRPFLGGGLALARGEIEASAFGMTADEDDTGLGSWLGGGVFWRIGDSFNIGLNLRYSTAEVEIVDEDIDVGGLHTGLLLGFGW